MKIEQIRDMIEGSSEDARFAAWMTLYSSDEPELKKEFDRILKDKDPILKILLANFLGHIHEEKAVQLILSLIEDANQVVVEAAEKSFDRNRYETKLNLLLRLIHSPVERTQFFAIGKMSLGGIVDMVPGLLEKLPQSKRPLLLQILTALRYFPGKKIIPSITPYLKNSDDDIRLKTIIIFGTLYENNYLVARKQLLLALQDKAPQVRQTALWCLRRKPHRRDLKYLFLLSVNDPDPLVRQESLLEMAFFPSPTVINHILHLITKEKDRIVLLKGEGVLLSFPEPELLHGLKKSLNSKNQAVKDKSVVLMAEFQHGSDTYFNFLIRDLHQTKTEKEKLPIIEALGVLGNKKAIPILEQFLTANALVSYVAMNALIRVWKNDPTRPVITYLQNNQLSVLAKQMILQNLLRSGIKGMSAKELADVLMPYLKHSNLNLRYLSAQIILKLDRDDAFESLLEVLKEEKDPTTFNLLKENLIRLFSEKPAFLLTLITKYYQHSETLKMILEMIKEVDWFGEKVILIITTLLAKPIDLMFSTEREHFVDFITNLIVHHKISFESLLQAIHPFPEKEKLLGDLALRFRQENFVVAIPIPLLATWLPESHDKQGEAIIELMGISQKREAINPLIALICDPAMTSLKKKAISTLNYLITGSS